MANIELDGANKKIKVDSGDLTLDVPGDIILDADGGDVVVADGGTNILKVTNSSSDVVLQPQVDAKDIIFKQYDGTTVATVEDNGTFNVPANKLAIGGTAVTATAAELNLIDGGTARGTTAIADGDGVLINDAGTMRQTTVETLKTYIGGFDVSSITGATELAVRPADTDELIISDAGTLKRIDFSHLSTTPNFHANQANTAISNNVGATVLYSNEAWDTGSLYNPSNGRFTVTSTTTGYYFLYAGVKFSNLTANRIQLRILYNNGSSNIQFAKTELQFDASGYAAPHVATVVPLTSADNYAYIEAYQNSGGSISLSNEVEGNYFGGFRIGG